MGVNISGKNISRAMGNIMEATHSRKIESREKQVILEENIDSKPLDQCVVLWRAVIMQALIDATNNYKKRDYKTYKAQAKSWLAGTSDDFYEVCELANYEPSYVKKMIRAALLKDSRKM